MKLSVEYTRVAAASKYIDAMRSKLKTALDMIEEIEYNVDKSDLDVEEKTEYYRLLELEEHIANIVESIDRKYAPVKAEGYLYKNEDGRYECGNYTLTSGSIVDYYDAEDGVYFTSRIEHNGDDYYIVGYGRNKSVAGVKVRIK